MKNIKEELRTKSDFFKNFFTLLSGSTIAQIIAILAIPILTRIYTPEDFGFFAIYLSLANILSSISSGRYELAIMLPENKKNALALVRGSIMIAVYSSLIFFIIIILVKKYAHSLSQFIDPVYFYFLPASILIMGLIKVLTQWYSRQKEFKQIAVAGIVQSGSTSATNIGVGFLFYIQSTGLFIGHIIGQFFQLIIFYSKFYKQEKEALKRISIQDIKNQLKENLNFPYYSAPMGFLNSISVDILIYILNLFYSTTLVGLYTTASKVINYPLNLISQSFISVFYQKISKSEKKVKLYLISFFSNLFLATIAMIPIILWGEELFIFVLGKEWKIAGLIAAYLAPITISSFAMRNVSNIFSLAKKNGILLVWQIIYLMIVLFVIFLNRSANFEQMILWVSIIGSMLYLILAFVGYKTLINTYEKST
jgi:O-antigen/teichoic acid export membrane protein